MKFKSIVLLAVAVGCGLVAMLGVQQILSGNGDEGEEMGKVLVVTAEMRQGTPLDETNTAFKEYPVSTIPEGAVTKASEFEDRTLKTPAVPGEFVMLAKLGDKGVKSAAFDIPIGLRVVTISVDKTKTHSGLIQPTDRVDILVTYKTRSEGRGMITKTKTVLEFIEVFATDHLRAADVVGEAAEINAKNISLLVTPDQANLLMLAENKGKLHLSLRSQIDSKPANTASVDELQFEDQLAGMGQTEEDEEPVVVTNVRDFLNSQNQATEEIAVVVQEVEVKEHPKWTVVVYAGEDTIEETFELPLPEEEAGETDETPVIKDETGKPVSALDGSLQKDFVGA